MIDSSVGQYPVWDDLIIDASVGEYPVLDDLIIDASVYPDFNYYNRYEISKLIWNDKIFFFFFYLQVLRGNVGNLLVTYKILEGK